MCLLCEIENPFANRDPQISKPRFGATSKKPGEDVLECLARMVAEKLGGSRADEKTVDLEANLTNNKIKACTAGTKPQNPLRSRIPMAWTSTMHKVAIRPWLRDQEVARNSCITGFSITNKKEGRRSV